MYSMVLISGSGLQEHITISAPMFSIPFSFLCSANDPDGRKALQVLAW